MVLYSGAIGAAVTFIGCALTTRALRAISILALTIVAGVAVAGLWWTIVDPVPTLMSENWWAYLALYLPWQSAVAACIGYALSRYVPEADEM